MPGTDTLTLGPPAVPVLPPPVRTELLSLSWRVSAARPEPWPDFAMASRSRPISPSKSPRDLSKTAPGSPPAPGEPAPAAGREPEPAVPDGVEPDLLAPALPEPEDWPAPAELEPAAPDGLLEPLDPLEPLELEPLAPPLPGRLAPEEPVVPAGGCMAELLQAARLRTTASWAAASRANRLTVRCAFMECGPVTDVSQYNARAD